MDLPQLSDEQLEQVREFCASPAAALLFQRLEAETLADWMLSEDPIGREKCWHRLRAILDLQAKLRNATTDKRLTERSQNIRTVTRSNP